MPLYRIHANFYSRLSQLASASAVELRGISVRPLATAHGVAPTFVDFFPCRFEEAFENLRALPSVDAEPDGFFVCCGFDGAERWRLSGHLFDFHDQLHRMELHGSCPAEVLEHCWRSIGWPEAQLACELVHEGVVLDEFAFRRWASASVDS